MTKQTINTYLVVVLGTLAEIEEDAPEGVLYAALMTAGCGMAEWQIVRSVLIGGGLAEARPGPCLRATDAGREMAAKISAAALGPT